MTDNPIRLDYQQYRAVRRLVHDCCNYDSGSCLVLDNGWEPCVCVQSIDYSLVCKWFRAAVLPTDKGLCAALKGGLIHSPFEQKPAKYKLWRCLIEPF